MRRILHSMGDTLRTNWGGILLFEMIYRLFSTILIVETASHGIRFALKRAGFSYLTAKNALRFLCSPITILVLLGLVLLILFLICLEMCVLYTAFQAGVVREKNESGENAGVRSKKSLGAVSDGKQAGNFTEYQFFSADAGLDLHPASGTCPSAQLSDSGCRRN